LLAPAAWVEPESNQIQPSLFRHFFIVVTPSTAMKKFLTTAPVFAAVWFTITAGILIEFNRFFPDLLFHPL
jgi:photosystem I subunit 9